MSKLEKIRYGLKKTIDYYYKRAEDRDDAIYDRRKTEEENYDKRIADNIYNHRIGKADRACKELLELENQEKQSYEN